MKILGIDPGLDGAVAVLDSNTIEAADIPTIGTGSQRCVDELALNRWLTASGKIDHAFIEYVSAMPGQGVSSMFRFGMAFGTLRAVVALAGIPYTLVTAAKWKKSYGLGRDKEASRQRVLQLWPKHAELFARKKDHQRAEALLLAAYGRQSLYPQSPRGRAPALRSL
jgi:crossover junction endodeoxyribonuclease RuvC